MAFINSSLLKHNIILGVDDRGKLSCQKVNLCFIYFESADCIKKLEQILEEKPPEENGSARLFDREEYLKVSENLAVSKKCDNCMAFSPQNVSESVW